MPCPLGHDKRNYIDWLCVGIVCAGICHEVSMTTTSANLTRAELPVDQEAPHLNPDQQKWPLKIYTFGRFGLVRDGVPLHFAGKVPRKPLELLKALIACGGRGVSEEQLIDHLWPNRDEGDATHSFSSALHRLRLLLGENQFIPRQDRRITLDQSYCWVDAWAFERLTKQAQSLMQQGESDHSPALQTALQAIVHYTGPFLPSDADQLWSISMRERLRDKMHNLITMVGQYWEASTEWHTALAIYQKGLEADDLYEDFYQRQMICYGQLGNHGEVASVYQRCRITLAMLGVKPSPRTTTVYEAALSSLK